jgi:sugar-specific transcriptional regulator TrmB
MHSEDFIKRMTELGFTKNEAKAYLSLLRNSPATRYEVSKASGIPRSAIYDVISRLEELGAVSAIYSEPENMFRCPRKNFLLSLITVLTPL